MMRKSAAVFFLFSVVIPVSAFEMELPELVSLIGYYQGETPIITNERVFLGMDTEGENPQIIIGDFYTNIFMKTKSVGSIVDKIDDAFFTTYVDGANISYFLWKPSEDKVTMHPFPYWFEHLMYYQNNEVFVSKLMYAEEGEFGFELHKYNIVTGKAEKVVEGIHFPLDLSPDKLMLLINNKRVLNTSTGEVITTVAELNSDNPIDRFVIQSEFLSNYLIIGNKRYRESIFDTHQKVIFSLDGRYKEEFVFYMRTLGGARERIKYIFFTPDFRHALVWFSADKKVSLVETSSFRDYLDSKNLLFRPTTAVSTESRVRVRENPNLEAQTFGHLEPGDELEVTDRSGIKVQIGDMNDWWYKIKRKSDGLEGWAYGAFLKLASYQGELGPK